MSLESEIKNLTAAVLGLTKRIDALATSPAQTESVEATPEPKPEPKSAKKKEPATVPVDDTITAESLQSLCMTIVKTDRSKGPIVKEILNEFNGAKIIKDINPDQYPVLKEALEALLNE